MKRWLEKKLNISYENGKTILAIEGLRGFAVFLVFMVHYNSMIQPFVINDISTNILGFFRNLGDLGVHFFFIISGYLIYGSIMKNNYFNTIIYIRKRIQRLYPTFLTILAIYIFLSFIFPNQSKLPNDTIASIIYIMQNILLLPGIFHIVPIVSVSWSLSYEIFYYILIPIVIFAFNLKAWPIKIRILFWIIITLIGFIFYGGHGLLMFIAGILLFEIHDNFNVDIRNGGIIFLILSLMIFGLKSYYDFNYKVSLFSVFILLLIFYLYVFNINSKCHQLFTWLPLRWLGNISYSYYLLHGLILKIFFMLFNYIPIVYFQDIALYYWLWIPLFILTLVGSLILFLLIEKPYSLSRQN